MRTINTDFHRWQWFLVFSVVVGFANAPARAESTHICIEDKNRSCFGKSVNVCNNISGCNFVTHHGGGGACEGAPHACYTNTTGTDCNEEYGCKWAEHECLRNEDCAGGGCCVFFIGKPADCRSPKCREDSDCPDGGFKCTDSRCDAECTPDPNVCLSPISYCQDVSKATKECANGIKETSHCGFESVCVAGRCTNEFGIPEGVIKDPDSPTIYYSNGHGHYCGYRNMHQFWCLTGKKKARNRWKWLENRPTLRVSSFTGMINDGTCGSPECDILPEGVFKDPDSSSIYFSNGEGHYCGYRNMDQLWCLTGKGGSNKWKWLAQRPEFRVQEYPGMIDDGNCHSPECDILPKGVFKDSDSSTIYFSNGEGHYCHYRNMAHLWCLTGKTGSGKWDWLNGRPKYEPENYPGMIHDGACHSPRCG